MHLPAEDWADAFLEATAKCKAVVIGPGLGTGDGRRRGDQGRDRRGAGAAGDRRRRAQRARRAPPPRAPCSTSGARPSILTPHDGEYARISGAAPGDDRLAAARRAGPGHRCRRPAEGPAHGGGRPRRGRRPTSCWRRPAARRWPRRAAATSSPASSAPSAPAGSRRCRRRPWPPTCTGGRRRSGPAQGLVAGDLPRLVARAALGAGP